MAREYRACTKGRHQLNQPDATSSPPWLDAILHHASSLAVIAIGADAHIEFFSPGAQRLTGYDATEMRGCSPERLFAPEAFSTWQEEAASAVVVFRTLAETAATKCVPVICKDGSRRSVQLSVSVWRSADSSTGYLIVLSDVTAATEACRTLARHYALFEDGPAVAFACASGEPDRIEEVSPNVWRLLGYAPETVCSPGWWPAHVHPVDRPLLAAPAAEVPPGSALPVRRYRMLHADGRWLWVAEMRQQGGDGRLHGYWRDASVQVDEQARLSKIASQISGVLYQLRLYPDNRARFVYASDGFERLYGVDSRRLAEDAWVLFEVIVPEDQPRVQASLRRAADTLTPWRCEYRIHWAGGVRWFEGFSMPEPMGDGSVVFHGHNLDITDRKLTEEALEQSRQRLELALESAEIGLWDWAATNDRLSYDSRLARILEMPGGSDAQGPGEAGIDAWKRLLHPDDAPAVEQAWRNHLAGRTPLYEAEYRLRHPRGGWKWLAVRGRVVERDGAGQPLRVIGVAQDIGVRKRADLALKDSEAHFRALFQSHHAVMVLVDPQTGCIVDANEAAVAFYGYPRARLVGMSMSQINALPQEELARRLRDATAQKHNHFVFGHRLASGEHRIVEVHSSPVESGGRTVLFSIVHDITARHRAEEALHTLQRLLQAVIDNIQAGVLMENDLGEVVIVNQLFCRLFGLDVAAESLLGSTCADILDPASRLFDQPERFVQRVKEVLAARALCAQEEWALRDGRTFERDHIPVEINGHYRGALWVYRDITQRKAQEMELRRLATTDALTGLPNRRSFMERLAQEFARFQRFGQPCSVLMLDIDHFKHINDTYGHAVGDLVLQGLSTLCLRNLRLTDTMGRLGGEEFAVLLPGCDELDAVEMAERLRTSVMEAGFPYQDLQLRITVSVGVASFEAGQDDMDAVLVLADKALYAAKRAGRNCSRVSRGDRNREREDSHA